MGEADALCHRIGIMDKGKLVTIGEPSKLKDALGGDLLSITSKTPGCAAKLKELGYSVIDNSQDGQIDFVASQAENLIPNLLETLRTCGIGVESISIKKPTLDDVFLNFTGTRIEEGDTFAATRRTRRTARRLG
jgi:ABC-2 type transport system ATP-binding protein